ncbi:unnamed protein product [Absidia cylindrospora]
MTEPWPSTCSTWQIGEYDVLDGLNSFYETSKYLANEKGNINDIRILALHMIFPFMLNQDESITKYLDHHAEINDDMASVSMPTRSVDLSLWCDSLTDGNDTFVGMKKKCFGIMEEAYKKGDATGILATNILFNLAPRVVQVDSYLIEDTFIHFYLDSILQDLFSTEEIFRQSWANSALESSATMKPDWQNYIRPVHAKIDIATCEIKPPSKQGAAADFSDFVNLGLEMRGMLNAMFDIIDVESAAVFGILVRGYMITTFKMDMKAHVYRMIQLGSCKIPSQQSDLGMFPALFRCLYHVKTLATVVAQKVKDAQLDRTNRKRKLPTRPPWCSSEALDITKQRRIDI